MARLLTLAAGALVIVSATGLYALKFDTRRIEQHVHGLERAIDKAESDIAVLRLERAYLARPDRIDTLSRRQGLEPIHPGQYRRPGALAGGEAKADADALAAARAILAPGGAEAGSGSP